MSRVIAVTACGFMLAACSATMPSLSLDFMKSAPQPETLDLLPCFRTDLCWKIPV
jgi:hypothetical protein